MKTILGLFISILFIVAIEGCKKDTIPNVSDTDWTVSYNWQSNLSGSFALSLYSDHTNNKSGTWSQYGSTVTFTFVSGNTTATYIGTVSSSNKMGGSMSNNYNDTGTWTAE